MSRVPSPEGATVTDQGMKPSPCCAVAEVAVNAVVGASGAVAPRPPAPLSVRHHRLHRAATVQGWGPLNLSAHPPPKRRPGRQETPRQPYRRTAATINGSDRPAAVPADLAGRRLNADVQRADLAQNAAKSYSNSSRLAAGATPLNASETHSTGVAKDAPPPCNTCRQWDFCATGHACERFNGWHHTGRRQDDLSGVPTAALYSRLFPEDAAAVAA